MPHTAEPKPGRPPRALADLARRAPFWLGVGIAALGTTGVVWFADVPVSDSMLTLHPDALLPQLEPVREAAAAARPVAPVSPPGLPCPP